MHANLGKIVLLRRDVRSGLAFFCMGYLKFYMKKGYYV